MSDKLRSDRDRPADANRRDEMPAVYFETHFLRESVWKDWPREFAIVTAWATTGEAWTDERNRSADCALETELRQLSNWVRRLTGYSPATGHAEPGWAVEIEFETACDIGLKYHQDAVYLVSGDTLSVSFCDRRRGLTDVGAFRCCVHERSDD